MPRNQKKYGFTILEVLLMVIVIGVSLSAIIVSLNNGMSFMQKTREKTIAINLAREGIEAMYQIRDTNRYRRAGKKEGCRLKKNPLVDEGGNGDCSNDIRIWTGNYILLTETTWWQQYFYLSWSYTTGLNLSDGIDTGDLQFSLCKWDNGIRSGCAAPISNEGKYFRAIRWIGLFNKAIATGWWQAISCPTGNDSPQCSDNSAKEYRFCSKVAYIGQWRWEVELCGLLTNFQKK